MALKVELAVATKSADEADLCLIELENDATKRARSIMALKVELVAATECTDEADLCLIELDDATESIELLNDTKSCLHDAKHYALMATRIVLSAK